MNLPSVIQCWASPGGLCWNTYLRWVGALRFICGSGTRFFHLRMSGPQMGSGVSPKTRMPQWWSRRWPPWNAPHRRKLHYVLSHCVCMLFLFGWPPCQRSGMTLMEVSQCALDSLYIRNIWLLYIVMFFLTWYGICIYFGWINFVWVWVWVMRRIKASTKCTIFYMLRTAFCVPCDIVPWCLGIISNVYW